MSPIPIRVHVDVRLPDGYLSSAWRWGQATESIRLGQHPNVFPDAAIHAAWAYLKDVSAAQTQKEMAAARRKHALLAAAHRLYRDAGPIRGVIETALRRNVDLAAIATATGLAVVVVAAYEALFFHVANVIDMRLFEAALAHEDDGDDDVQILIDSML